MDEDDNPPQQAGSRLDFVGWVSAVQPTANACNPVGCAVLTSPTGPVFPLGVESQKMIPKILETEFMANPH